MKHVLGGVCLLFAWAVAMAAPVDLDHHLKREEFGQIQLSPDGTRVAIIVPYEDRTGLVTIRLADMAVTGNFVPRHGNHVSSFVWANDERVLLSLAEKFSRLEQPQPTGEIYSLRVNGGRGELLVGYRVAEQEVGSRIQRRQTEAVAAFVLDTLGKTGNHVLIRTWPLGSSEPVTGVERMDVRTGNRTPVTRAPVRRADFQTDHAGQLRMALGAETDNASKLYHRSGPKAEWELVNDQLVSGRIEIPLGFSADNRTAYLQVTQADGPDAVVAWDTETGTRNVVAQDKVGDPVGVLLRPGTQVPAGVEIALPTPHTLFFPGNEDVERLYRSLEAALAGPVRITSSTRDGAKSLVFQGDDRNPGDYYLFDTQSKELRLVLSRARHVDPERSATTRPIALAARDGLPLQGYITRPAGHPGGALPMVVLPHGGPYGIHDDSGYEYERQLLAAAGYAVLQVNFRGSGGLGHRHRQIGARQWGLTMQDDVTDATRWAIEQGVADPGRICLHGASYGAYAALMGVVREPALYRCASGSVGVYDLPMMQRDDAREERWLGNWSRDWVGIDEAALAAVSPSRLAERIQVPVLLASGGQDRIAPPRHTESMAQALRRAGKPVEVLEFPTEGHGFYKPENQRAYYRRLLDFLADNIGGERAAQ